jgi:pimeloyl-ACP methyl ester carboxylesterase
MSGSSVRLFPVTHHRYESIDSVKIFYREAGPRDAPVVLLLHGYPTSSHMFRHLIPALADRYRVIAPDYPGFGQSDMPPRSTHAYTFDWFAELFGKLFQRLGIGRYALYVMDFGAPVGYRLALANPSQVAALIIQNGNAYEEGMGDFWNPVREFWADGSEATRAPLAKVMTLESTIFQYTAGVRDPSRVSPDNWAHDQPLLDRPGNLEIQLDLLYDYRTNLPLYPRVQGWLRKYQPPGLLVWGKNDPFFIEPGAHAYKRDLRNLEFHLLDTGHFLLEDQPDVAFPLIRDFLDRALPRHIG